MGGIVDTITGKSARDAARAASEGANLAAKGQEEALEYMKEREALPRQFSEAGLTRLAGLYGLPGGEGSQADLIEQAKASPLYGAIMGTRKAGEEAILRGASATGGLRSGNVNRALYDENQRLEERALLESYGQQLGGLTGLAGLPSNANAIAQGIAAPSMTRAQGLISGANVKHQAAGQLTSNTMDLIGQIFGGSGGAMAFCDARLKTNTKEIGHSNGHKLYAWKWSDKAAELGLEGIGCGVMAHEVAEDHPQAVGVADNGYLVVNMEELGLTEEDVAFAFMSACGKSLKGVDHVKR